MFTLKLKLKFTSVLKLLYSSLKVMVKVCFYIKFQSYDVNQKYHSKLLNYFNATFNFGITCLWVLSVLKVFLWNNFFNHLRVVY